MIDLTELKSRAEALIGRDDIRLAPDVILALIAENERLTNRLEVDPRHDYDGISTRDATVKVLDEQVDQLKAENEQLKAENERLSTENSEIESAAITYIEDMQEARRENARLTELFTVGMTLDGNLRVYGDWQSVRKAQEILAERDQLRAEIAGLKTGYEAYERVNAELKAENQAMAEFKNHMVGLREAHGFDSWSAVLVELDRLKAENEALRKALESCADELLAEIICKHGSQKLEDMHPVTRRLYERDMAPVIEARAALGQGEQS